jgi:hypothetical protein
MKERPPKNTQYDWANLEADEVIDKYLGGLIGRHVNCNCWQCKITAKFLAQDWFGEDGYDDIMKRRS